MLEFDESYNERDIELPVGEAFEVRLPENPTTGFRWNFSSSGEPACELLDNSFEIVADRPGRGGSHSWQFRVAQAGHGIIELVYRRSWERDKTPARKFALHVYTYP